MLRGISNKVRAQDPLLLDAEYGSSALALPSTHLPHHAQLKCCVIRCQQPFTHKATLVAAEASLATFPSS